MMARKRRHTPEQVIGKLREAEVKLAKSTAIAQVCKDLSITEETSPDCPRRHSSAGCVYAPSLASSSLTSRRIDSKSGCAPRPVTTSRRLPPSPIRRDGTNPRRTQL